MQSKVVQGRSLEIESEYTCPEGATNYILVDRYHILETGMEETNGLKNPFLTLDVQFYGEQALTSRKNVCACVNITEICIANVLSSVPNVVKNSKWEPLWICEQIPLVREIFRPNTASVLTMRNLNALLMPHFSPVGSNKRMSETAVYTLLCKYMRQVAAGRRGDITLGWILQFATCCDEEPLLGFKLPPSIKFVEVTTSFLPMANTCTNVMLLPYASHSTVPLPSQDQLFSLYDEAFSSAHFGNV